MQTFEIVSLTPGNLDQYDLFCFKSKSSSEAYQQKLQWFRDNYAKGLRIKVLYVDEGKSKMVSRGFIEYISGENNWRGIEAEGWLVIHCLWIIGRQKGKGYARALLEECMKDAKDKGLHGVVGATSKSTWLLKSAFYTKMGFSLVDSWRKQFELYAYSFSNETKLVMPRFNVSIINPNKFPKGFVVFRSAQCPYTLSMVHWIKKFAFDNNLPFEEQLITQSNPSYHPYGSFYILFNGKPLGYEPDPKKFVKQFSLVKNT